MVAQPTTAQADSIAAALMAQAEHYSIQFNDSALILGEEAVRFTREQKLNDLQFKALHALIHNYVLQGYRLTAIRKAEEGYAEAKELQDNLPTARMLAAFGLIYNEMGLFEDALRYYEESNRVANQKRQAGNTIYRYIYENLATLSYVTKRFSDVLRYADSLLVELERLHEATPTADLKTFYFLEEYFHAVAYANLKRPQQSLQAIRRAEALFEPQWRGTWYDNVVDEMYVDYYLAAKNYDKALEYIEQTLQFYEDNLLELDMLAKQREKASALFNKGAYKTSAEIYRTVIDRTDSLKLQQFYGQINELRTLYELDKAEMEAERQQQAIRKQLVVIASLAFACAALLVIVSLVVWNRRRIMEKNRALYRQIKEQDRLTTAVQSAAFPQIGDERQQQLVARLHEYLLCEQTFAKPDIDTDELVARLATNRTSLFTAIKAVTGKTLQEYVNEMKLNEARQLLEATAQPLDSIIELCGFASKSTFYRLFSEHYNMPPAEYRNIAKQ